MRITSGNQLVAIAICAMAGRGVVADQAVVVFPVADSFVRQLDPGSNFGGAGADCVGGPDSVNGQSQLCGRFDSVIMFDMSAAVATLDGSYGAGRWSITGVTLQLNEVGAPISPVFPRGAGSFVVNWLSDDSWTEGNGTPASPMPGTGSIITWDSLQTILTTAAEAPLGVFASAGTDNTTQFTLVPAAPLIADMSAGGLVSLHLLPQSLQIGFTFHSWNFGTPSAQPQLIVVAGRSGDLNCDDVTDPADVGPFALALVDPVGYASQYPGCSILRADVNHDGMVDGRDVAGFVALLVP